jgi:putative ABC transport system permease protein
MRLLGGFAAIALTLSAIGVYGVVSYAVSRRTREFGTRVALGATRADVITLVMRQAITLAGAGLAVGVIAGLVSARALSSVLFGVPPWDLVTLSAAVAVLALAVLTASYLPARRAAAVDPATTLAAE